MPDAARTVLKRKIREAIDKPKERAALNRSMERGRTSRAVRIATFPGGDAFRDEVKAIKDRCLEQQDQLLLKFIRNAEARGVKVFLAKDGPEAIAYTLRIAAERNYTRVAKSKSLTTEEIEMNHDMEAAGMQVVETDLGELILQLVHEKPFHLVFPAVHKTIAQVAEIFANNTGKTVENSIEAIMPVVKGYLRPIFLSAQIGMTGANVGVAETGGIVIETNEGNARLVSTIGECHICVMGVEKIVDTIEDAMMMVMAHPVSSTGQMPTTYVTWMHGRSPLGEGGTPRESHIIILDNGRSRMRQDPIMRDALNCIRCGACMNICPTYTVTGGHTFGHIYPGPIGIPWTASVHGLEEAGAFVDLCISCGLCKEICPAKIDIPLMIAEVKHRWLEKHPQPRVNKMLINAERASKLGCAFAPLSNWVTRNPLFRLALEKFGGIERHRHLPPFARKTLRQLYPATVPKLRFQPTQPLKVAYFHDLYFNYNRPDLGMLAIKYLQELGAEVVLPEQEGSGYPCIGYGELDQAREIGARNLARLAPYVRDGYAIVATEPTATYCLQVSYPKLLPFNPYAKDVAANTWEFFAYLLENEATPEEKPLNGRRFGFHCSCHQRPLGRGDEVIAWLERRGAVVERIETGTCCGMGGTFGLKHGELGYDLSQAVGETLFQRFKDSGVEAIVTESSVCSMQLAEGTGMKVYHPLELL